METLAHKFLSSFTDVALAIIAMYGAKWGLCDKSIFVGVLIGLVTARAANGGAKNTIRAITGASETVSKKVSIPPVSSGILFLLAASIAQMFRRG